MERVKDLLRRKTRKEILARSGSRLCLLRLAETSRDSCLKLEQSGFLFVRKEDVARNEFNCFPSYVLCVEFLSGCRTSERLDALSSPLPSGP